MSRAFAFLAHAPSRESLYHLAAVEPFDVVIVPPHARREDETLGTKFKFWYYDENDDKILFKRGRDNEDWSEKIAAELAHAIGVPAADVELAELEGTRGIVSPTFLAPHEHLHHGNELLMGLDHEYPQEERYHVGQHTVQAVMSALEHFEASPTPLEAPPIEPWTATAQMVGYLMLDAVIGNTDRHHENWAVTMRGDAASLAPTYDHASSLGRNEPERKARLRVEGGDPRVTVEAYVARARSAFYASREATKPLTTLEAFEAAAALHPAAGRAWYARLARITASEVENLFERLPDDRISAVHRRLAARMIVVNTQRIAEVVGA